MYGYTSGASIAHTGEQSWCWPAGEKVAFLRSGGMEVSEVSDAKLSWELRACDFFGRQVDSSRR